jgi:deoxycytidine triphosphate deaminase
MAVIDLSTRLTNDWNQYQNNKRSSDSYIYISPLSYKLDDGPASVDLSVGDKWFVQNNNVAYTITEEGVTLNPFQSILIETQEQISLPYNVFGLVTGKGLQIFQGTFVSTGKINPAYNAKLKIGIYNGSNKRITLQSGAPLCTCVFFEMESSLHTPLKSATDDSLISVKPVGFYNKALTLIKEHKDVFIVVVSTLALLVSLLNIVFNKNFIYYRSEANSTQNINTTRK